MFIQKTTKSPLKRAEKLLISERLIYVENTYYFYASCILSLKGIKSVHALLIHNETLRSCKLESFAVL